MMHISWSQHVGKALLQRRAICHAHRLRSGPHSRLSFSSAASSNLLGHSPMAPQLPFNQSATSQIPTAQDVSNTGGVWAPSSAKREKLKELQAELAEDKDQGLNRTLDDMATKEERLDLYLADGLAAIVSALESNCLEIAADGSDAILAAALQSLDEHIPSGSLSQSEWEARLEALSKALETILAALPPDRCLYDIRDFLLPSDANAASEQGLLMEHQHAQEGIIRFRLILAKAAADHLKASWNILTTLSDQDIDRAAVLGTVAPKQATTINGERLKNVVEAFMAKDCTRRAEAMWALMDRDDDGLLDETEMNQVGQLTVEPVRMALTRLFQESLDASPVRTALSSDDDKKANLNKRLGWRQRRREMKEKKRLSKLFNHTVQSHFVDEVEMPHRMRCIYAWANKNHQDNKIDSVLVDDAGWSGRKRYVELLPKISYLEFKEVQDEHFQHYNRVGSELLKGYREHLWVVQGRQRQRRQLYKNGVLFLIGISIVDYAILAM